MRGVLIALCAAPWCLPAPASAQEPCLFCADSIVVDRVTAECFLAEFDRLVSRAATSPLGVVPVTLTLCSDKTRGLGTRLPESPPPGACPEPVDTSFLADATGLKCLRAKLATRIDGCVRVDLTKGC